MKSYLYPLDSKFVFFLVIAKSRSLNVNFLLLLHLLTDSKRYTLLYFTDLCVRVHWSSHDNSRSDLCLEIATNTFCSGLSLNFGAIDRTEARNVRNSSTVKLRLFCHQLER